MNVTQLKEALPVLLKAGITPNILGRHGTGKSELTRKIFEDLGYRVIDIRLGQMADAGDLVGLPEFDRDENNRALATRFITPDRFPKKGEKAIIFFDEMNRANKDILQAIFEMVLDYRMGDYSLDRTKLEDGMPLQAVITAGNPPTDDYSTLDFSDKAFQDRFCHIKFEPSHKEWLSYARKSKISPELISFIADQPSMLEGKTKDFELDEIKPSRRSIVAADRIIKQKASVNVEIELLHGMVGVECATAFASFRANYDQALKGIEVLKDYAKVKEQVELFSSVEGDRQDILSNTLEEIEAYVIEKGKMTKKEQENLIKFLTTIQLGLGFGFIKRFFTGKLNGIFTNCKVLLASKELTDHFANANVAKLEMEAMSKEEKESKEEAKEKTEV